MYKASILLILLIFLSSCRTGPVDPNPVVDKKTGKKVHTMAFLEVKIDEYMEMMDWPERAVFKLERRKNLDHPDVKKFAAAFVENMLKTTKLKHPDEKFNKLSMESYKTTVVFQKAVESGKLDLIKKEWKNVQNACTKCHDIYD